MKRPRAGVCIAVLLTLLGATRAYAQWPVDTQSAGCAGDPPIAAFDGRADRLLRRTDFNAAASLGLGVHRVPELVGIRVHNWSPANSTTGPFGGCWQNVGGFVRLEIAFAGLLNPPGRVGLATPDYAPFEYGPHPVSGFIEIDVDDNVNTGGDFSTPQNMYTGNIARFGGLPTNGALFDRVARLGVEVDSFTGSAAAVERSGEDFHIALFGDQINEVIEVSGDGDNVFEAGETWLVRGPLLHRAHGYAIFSSANGDGEYEPVVDLEFRHDVQSDVTIVSLVYPLTNAAAAAISGAGIQPQDGNSNNQNSILEALTDLKTSLANLNPQLPGHPAYPLIQFWENEDPAAYLNATHWRITCHVGMSYPAQDPFRAFIAWTDAYPNAMRGDFNGDGYVTAADLTAFDTFVAQFDGMPPIDVDNAVNNAIALSNFAENFCMFDVDYDGDVDAQDRHAIPLDGDMNGDQTVDMQDVPVLVDQLLHPHLSASPCENATPIGACCIAPGFGPDICVDALPEQCAAQSGSFMGAGTACAVDGCAFPTGACCTSVFGAPATPCFEATQSECSQLAGYYYGNGTTCDDANVSCETIVNEGACCLNSPAQRCTRTTQAGCASVGGVFQGVGTHCTDPGIACTIEPEPAPCCTPAGGCAMISPQVCLSQGGVPLLSAASCAEVDCPPPNVTGACCLLGGGAVACFDMTAIECFNAGGTFLGANTNCTNAQCGSQPARACCLPDSSCQSLSAFDCLTIGGTPQPPGTDCANANCAIIGQSTGACCVSLPGLSSDRCLEISETDCISQGGSFAGIDTFCDAASIPCPNVILSPLPNISTFVNILLDRINDSTAVATADINQDGFADGRDVPPYVDQMLSGDAAPVGACCLSDITANQVCLVVSDQDCNTIGGSFLGAETACNGAACPVVETITMACCLPDGCMNLTPSDCAAAGGTHDPDALSCSQRATRMRLERMDINHDNVVNGRDIPALVHRLMGH